VALYTATSTSQRISFNIINRKTGNRIRYDVVDAETGEEVEKEDRVKGYKLDSKDYLLLDDEELENVALESTHTIDIEEFVPIADVDRIYLDESYYIVPQDEVAQEAFAVIREAMRKEELAGVARVVLHRREHILLLRPRGKGLIATTLRYKNEVRNQDDYFDEIPNVKVSADMLKLATHILDTKKGEFKPEKFEDRYEDALKALIKAKQQGKELPVVSEPKPSNVINLMDALRRSAKGEKSGESAARRAPARRGSAKSHARKRPAARKKVRRAG
jgi:DNA end-binding protein Ku